MLTKKLKTILLSLAVFSGGVSFAQSNSAPVYNIGQINVGAQQASSKQKKIEKRYHRATLKLKDKTIFESAQTIKVIKKDQLKVAGPTGSVSQVLSYAPGVTISSFGENGSRKFSIVLNGIRQGWGGFTNATSIDNGSLGVTFDGVPLVNPSTGLWQSNQIPQLDLIQGIRVIYGPGNPESRWYNDLGGQIQFIPLQPSKYMGGFFDLSYGSFNSRNLFVAFNTGDIKGWRTVVAAGWGADNSYVTSVDGFRYPSHNYAYYIKTKKVFADGDGDFSIGAYAAQSYYWRNPPIPVSPQQGLTADGTPNTPLLSQSTTGFYSAPDFSVLHKLDQNGLDLVYSKLNLNFDKNTKFHNMIWFRYGFRRHNHYNDYPLGSNPGNLYEYNNPYDKVFGDKLWFELNNIYHNNIAFGGYYLVSNYNSRNAFWNPSVELAPGIYGSATVPNAKYRSDYWNQTDIASFAEDTIKFHKFKFTPGIRWVDFITDYNNETCTDFPLACQLNPKRNEAKLPSAHTNFTKLEPSFDANYEIIDGISIYGNYAETYKVPENGGGGGPYQKVPASELHLEKSQEYQIGFKVLKQNLKYANKIFAGVNYFHMIFSHLFFPIYDSNGNYLGDGAGTSVYNGVNLFADYYPIKHLYLWTNATFEDAKFPNYTFTNANGNITSASDLPVSYVPHTLFNLDVSYSYLINYLHGIITKPSVWFQYVGSQSMFNNNTGLPDTQKMPSYNTLNASISFDILNTARSIPYFKDIQLTLTALNITNKKYNEFEYISSGGYYNVNESYIQAYPGAPFTVYGSIKADF
ncbi:MULTISPECIES: TonB-dependent receptor [unclassified Hydrogenobaculum]|uniref:TonB-dependent receptor n=1 Tax=unclassified Hydrogenobaculum TaxID=2622382 RepID=UPI0001C502CB|nr:MULTISPECIES: TonB-dependent receptor [unclassified Hydrogenobaculum]AEF19094.1 TonB-dependent receptor [Hydrogenobaculum sp. 3684]AEG46384.1 TonB-dependent receptor [Hydrogenobaculum sp. SHO]AGG15027.1 TonB-dependent receptor [Hydrogenobaculum sp. HO]AGH93324.1 outer membrane receptor protein [Hydrogenobaculum sp. SN]